MKTAKILALIGCFLIASCGIKNGNDEAEDKIIKMDVDSVFSEWESGTYKIISEIYVLDSSRIFPPTEYHQQPYTETEFIKEAIINTRESVMRPLLPVLLNTTDSVLVAESYYVEYDEISIYGAGTEYIYRIDKASRLPKLVEARKNNLTEVVGQVVEGYYYCPVQGLITDFTCYTLVTKHKGNLCFQILALTMNDIICGGCGG
ncbi:MAG: hypothetical protein IJQ89_02165 [Bacteroidales bacterium]|nr:hypothetical protein [Bacteroidales bacterium]